MPPFGRTMGMHRCIRHWPKLHKATHWVLIKYMGTCKCRKHPSGRLWTPREQKCAIFWYFWRFRTIYYTTTTVSWRFRGGFMLFLDLACDAWVPGGPRGGITSAHVLENVLKDGRALFLCLFSYSNAWLPTRERAFYYLGVQGDKAWYYPFRNSMSPTRMCNFKRPGGVVRWLASLGANYQI